MCSVQCASALLLEPNADKMGPYSVMSANSGSASACERGVLWVTTGIGEKPSTYK